MPIHYARHLIGRDRTDAANKEPGIVLAFVAGAVNAGGFLAVQQYTSHMTGIGSPMADRIAPATYGAALTAFGALLSFTAGAACCAIMINYARRRNMLAMLGLSFFAGGGDGRIQLSVFRLPGDGPVGDRTVRAGTGADFR